MATVQPLPDILDRDVERDKKICSTSTSVLTPATAAAADAADHDEDTNNKHQRGGGLQRILMSSKKEKARTVLKSALRPSRLALRSRICIYTRSTSAGTTSDDGGPASTGNHIMLKKAFRRQTSAPVSSRRVRGLWNDRTDCIACRFSQFHDEIIADHIFNYLTLEDLLSAAMSCRRFAYCANQPSCWRHVDATDYVGRLYGMYLKESSSSSPSSSSSLCDTTDDHQTLTTAAKLAKNKTSTALIAKLARHKNDIESLTIRNIDNKLSADVAVMGIGACFSTGRLCELILTSYAELTDSLVNIMFLSRSVTDATHTIRSMNMNAFTSVPTQRKLDSGEIVSISPRFRLSNKIVSGLNAKALTQGSPTILRLENCRLLTDAVVRMIVVNCPDISTLSLRGCSNITDSGILALAPLLKLAPSLSRDEGEVTSSDEGSAVITPPSSPVKPDNAVPSTPLRPTTSSLSSLFQVPSPASVATSLSSSLPSPSFMSVFNDPAASKPPPPTPGEDVALFMPAPVKKTASLPLMFQHRDHVPPVGLRQQHGLHTQQKQSRRLCSLDLAHTGVTMNGIAGMCRGDMLAMEEMIVSVEDDSAAFLLRDTLEGLLSSSQALNIIVVSDSAGGGSSVTDSSV